MQKKLINALLATTAISCTVAHALPDARKGSPLASQGIATPVGVGDIIPDHKEEKTLHVGPAGEKEITGLYAELGSTGPQCADFSNIQAQTYRIPATPVQMEQAYNDRDYVSNWFQLSYNIPRSNIVGLNAIKEARDEVRNAGAQNQAMLANYNTLNAKWNDLGISISDLQGQIDDIAIARTGEQNTCIATYAATDPTEMVNCIVGVINKYAVLSAQLTAEIAPLKAERDAIKNDYFAARGLYDAFTQELELINGDIVFHTLIIGAQMNVTSNAWKLEKDVLAAEEGKIVGRASAGYTLFANETNLLADTLYNAGLGQYTVKQLDVFNIALNSGVTVDNPNVSVSGAPLFTKNTWTTPADTLINTGITSNWEMPFEREERGDTINFDAMDENSFGSGGFDFYVTKAARCGEYTQTVEEEYTGGDNGQTASWKVSRKLYEPQPDRIVFAQNIGLSYNYYAFPGPLKGDCEINVDRMSSYWRDKGRSKSWRWFKSKTRTWDHTRQEARDNMGMSCTLDLVPTAGSPAEAAAIAEEFERNMYNDMWQMFLAIYAESYEVEVIDPEIVDPGKSTVGESLGSGLLKVCPANMYCQFANVVLKTLDQLGGSKAQGTTSSQSRVYGTIRKTYDKNTWTIKQGNALVKAKVCVDHNQCN